MFRKKVPFRRIFPSKSSESDRVFNDLHDSNSIFLAAGINSEIFFGRMVKEKGCGERNRKKESKEESVTGRCGLSGPVGFLLSRIFVVVSIPGALLE